MPLARTGNASRISGPAIAIGRGSGRGRADLLADRLVALPLDALHELRAAVLDDAALEHDVDVRRLDEVQDPLIVRDDQDAERRALAHRVDAVGDDLKRVDVQAGVRLVED